MTHAPSAYDPIFAGGSLDSLAARENDSTDSGQPTHRATYLDLSENLDKVIESIRERRVNAAHDYMEEAEGRTETSRAVDE